MIFSSWSLEAWAPIITSVSSGLPVTMREVRSTTASRNFSAIDSCTSARDGHVQISPWFSANRVKPSCALSQ